MRISHFIAIVAFTAVAATLCFPLMAAAFIDVQPSLPATSDPQRFSVADPNIYLGTASRIVGSRIEAVVAIDNHSEEELTATYDRPFSAYITLPPGLAFESCTIETTEDSVVRQSICRAEGRFVRWASTDLTLHKGDQIKLSLKLRITSDARLGKQTMSGRAFAFLPTACGHAASCDTTNYQRFYTAFDRIVVVTR